MQYFLYHKTASTVVIFLLFQASLFACDIPVFSYAMQNWHADLYRIHIFHRDVLTSEAEHLVQDMKRLSASDSGLANIEVDLVNLEATEDATLLELYQTHLAGTDPGLLVQYPASSRIAAPLYAGPMTENMVRQLLDSPIRRELAERLLRGEMAVWILLESGNRRQDNRAARLLERELERMTEVLELPDKSLWVWSNTLDAEAGIRFSVLRLDRNAPEEAVVVNMLRGTESDLAERDDTPMAFPVYGRGLALYALVGAGINEWTIADACEFVIGPCPCVVKASNPGVDMLMAVNWKKHVQPIPYFEQPVLTGLGDFFERGEAAAAQLAALDQELEVATKEPAETAASSHNYPGWFGGSLFFVVALCAGAGYSRLHAKRKKAS